ncbi:unnamed protein product [marine sediment metagenome]|uniref:Carrier domain-containing protein n=1 Tax=marine sediment metagenome TaxID=412755 RepID=X0U0U0_9ZZZZ
MEKDSIEDRIKKIIGEVFKKNPKEISRKTRFIEDLRAKSIDVIALLAALSGEFKIVIPASEIQGNQTVGQAIDYIKKKLSS